MTNGYNSEEEVCFHFDPTEQEVIKNYLVRKQRGEACGDFIVEKNVYAKEPWLLDHTNDPFFKEDQWYYFVRRTQISEQKIGCGKRAKRQITGDNNDGIDHGYWRANGKKNIIDEETGEIIGVNQSLTFNMSNNDNNKKKHKRGDGASATVPGSESSWIMNEFVLPSDKKNTFQKLVLCKITKKKNPKKKDDDHHEVSTSTCHHHHESFYSEQQSVNEAHHQNPEIPRIGSMSLTCSISEKERNIEQCVEGSMIHQVDAFSLEKKNEKAEAMEGQKHVLGNFPTKRIVERVLIDTKDQQTPVLFPARLNAPHVRLGDKSLPIELDNDNEEDEEEWGKDFYAFLKFIGEDAPNM